MNVTQVGEAAQVAGIVAALLATSLSVGIDRRTAGSGRFLLSTGFLAMLASWLATRYYPAILRFIFGLANPTSVFPWQQVADALSTTPRALEAIGYLLLATAVLTVGRGYVRHYPRARARTLALLTGSFALLVLSAAAGALRALPLERLIGPALEQSSLWAFFAGNGIELIYRAINLLACLLLVLGLLGMRRELRPAAYREENTGGEGSG